MSFKYFLFFFISFYCSLSYSVEDKKEYEQRLNTLETFARLELKKIQLGKGSDYTKADLLFILRENRKCREEFLK